MIPKRMLADLRRAHGKAWPFGRSLPDPRPPIDDMAVVQADVEEHGKLHNQMRDRGYVLDCGNEGCPFV